MLTIEAIGQLNRERLAPITVLAGDDAGQYAQLKERLLSQIGYDLSDLSLSYFDLSEVPYEVAALDLESLSLFAEDKLVVLDHCYDLTTDKKHYLDDNALKRFEAYLENPLATTRLIILAPGKLDGKRRLVKLLRRQGQVFETQALKPKELMAYFQKEARAAGLQFESGVFELLLAKSNADFSQMAQNLAFLKAYKSDGMVTHEDIAVAIPKTLQDNIFDVTQLILSQKVDAARSLIRDLTLQGEDEVKLVAVLLSQFRLLTQVKLLASLGQTESQMLDSLEDYLGRRPNPYQIKYAVRDSRGLSLAFLQKSLQLLIETDYDIKTSLNDKDYLLDLLILKLMAEKSQTNQL